MYSLLLGFMVTRGNKAYNHNKYNLMYQLGIYLHSIHFLKIHIEMVTKPGSGVACCQAVTAHPHFERQVVRSGDDRVPVLGYHPHAAQVVAQEVLHLAALQVDVAEVRHYSLRIEELGISITYQRAYCILLRVIADDFRCQVKQIIEDFKAAERIVCDISVGVVGVAHPLCARVGR